MVTATHRIAFRTKETKHNGDIEIYSSKGTMNLRNEHSSRRKRGILERGTIRSPHSNGRNKEKLELILSKKLRENQIHLTISN